MKPTSLLATILLSAVTAFAVTQFAPHEQAATLQKETAFERVMRTQTIRCAYAAPVLPRFTNDPATGQKGGLTYELVEAIGAALHLKIDWVEEVTYANFPENLRIGKEDMFCNTIWISSARAQKIITSSPTSFMQLYAYVRADDHRFDNNIELLNTESTTFATMDGTTLESVVMTTFPKAKRQSVPSASDHVQPIMDVALGKADVVIYDSFTIENYNRKNPDKPLRRAIDTPIRIYGETLAVAMGEWELREMVNTAISELITNGTIDRIYKKYEPEYGEILRPKPAYAP